MFKTNKKGFTLVELLAVIVVLGIIISIAVPTAMNLINNSKKKAFVYDAKAYIDSARYTVLSENGKKTFFKLNELSVKNSKDYYEGVVFAEKDENGHYKYSIFMYDTNSNKILGQTNFDRIMLLNEDELDTSKIREFDSAKFGTILKQNLNNNEKIKMITKDDEPITISINKDGSISRNKSLIKIGALVYLKKTYNNQKTCQPFRVIRNDDDSISLFDSDSRTDTFVNIGNTNAHYIDSYSQLYGIDKNDLFVRLLTVNDLYYYLDYEKNGFTQSLLTENIKKIAELYKPGYSEYYDSFYSGEWKSSTFPRFISLGTYGDDDYCNADGAYKETEISEKVCYAFSLKEVYHGGKLDGPAKIVNVANNSYLTFNNIVNLENYYNYAYKDSKCEQLYINDIQKDSSVVSQNEQ